MGGFADILVRHSIELMIGLISTDKPVGGDQTRPYFVIDLSAVLARCS